MLQKDWIRSLIPMKKNESSQRSLSDLDHIRVYKGKAVTKIQIYWWRVVCRPNAMIYSEKEQIIFCLQKVITTPLHKSFHKTTVPHDLICQFRSASPLHLPQALQPRAMSWSLPSSQAEFGVAKCPILLMQRFETIVDHTC
jgi:hypothetical protein